MELEVHRLDELLDRALHNYGAVEPRIGLEGRVLARLQAEREKPAGGAGRWVLATTAAAAAAALGIALFRSVPPRPAPAPLPAVASIGHPPMAGSPRPPVLSQSRPKPHTLSTGYPAAGASARPLEANAIAETLPKRDRFPTPEPLSEQEQMLAIYVQQFHREATLMARAQTRLREQEMGERELPATGGETSRDPSQEQLSQEQP
jgi:hypothetical protein